MIPPTYLPVPEGKSYLPYQEECIRYAIARRGTIVADEMGLGKTIEAIGIINADTLALRILIICPTSLRANWWREIEAWLTPRPNQNISVLTFDAAQKTSIGDTDILIIDEAHLCKNPETKRTQAIKRIAQKAKRVICLTGTPITNKPIDLWSLLQITAPNAWDPAFKPIKLNPLPSARVITSSRPLKRKKSLLAGEGNGFFRFVKQFCGAKQIYVGKNKKVWTFTGATNLDRLQEQLRKTCMIRREKKDVLAQLPDKRRQIIILGETENNFEITEAQIENLHLDRVLFQEFSRARQKQGREKLSKCIEHIKLLMENTDKLIVFAHHQSVILELEHYLCDYNPLTVTGETPPNARAWMVERFQNCADFRIFIGSIGAAGVGFTLTASSTVVFVELDPVPARMWQAEDRAHRIGQKDNVLVQYLVTENSIDAHIAKILMKKKDIIQQAINR